MDAAVRRVTVIGRGEATAEPDVVGVRLGVQTDAGTAREALAENNARMRSLVARLQELGIAERDVRTSHVGIWPRHDHMGRAAHGYHASNSLIVTIRDADRTGEMLGEIVDAGANEVSGVFAGVEDATPLEEAAFSRAIANARERAELAARAAGATLGSVLSISEEIGATPYPYPEDRAASFAAAAGEGVPFHPDEEKVRARVQVTFELKTDGEVAT